MKNNVVLLSVVLLLTAFYSCKASVLSDNRIEPMSVIFDTDMGNDIDDALALDMLYKYVDEGRMKLLAIMSNKDSPYATEFIDIMNTWYGYPTIPIGTIKQGVIIDDYKNYAENVCKLTHQNAPMFPRTLSAQTKLEESHILYRKVLAEQPDNSVTVISVGFSTNIARLLNSEPDQYSNLTGKELVAKKVKLLSVMAGDFIEKPRKEFNVVHDISSAQTLFAQWPGKIVVSPFHVGSKIQFPASVIQNDFDRSELNPLVEAYYQYRPMPYNRATWDLTSVLYVAEPDSLFFTSSPAGSISVNDEGYTIFEARTDGKHTYLAVEPEQVDRIKDYFIRLIKKKAKNRE